MDEDQRTHADECECDQCWYDQLGWDPRRTDAWGDWLRSVQAD